MAMVITGNMKGKAEHEQYGIATKKKPSLRREHTSVSIQIPINSLKPSEDKSESKSASQDKSFVFFMRKNPKKCKPSAKKASSV